ncbi:hypothetical protein TPA0909_60730 [Streptomyces albus]|nr:hypothetical protein TPA0909_60730 [Streptomyces albus]
MAASGSSTWWPSLTALRPEGEGVGLVGQQRVGKSRRRTARLPGEKAVGWYMDVSRSLGSRTPQCRVQVVVARVHQVEPMTGRPEELLRFAVREGTAAEPAAGQQPGSRRDGEVALPFV